MATINTETKAKVVASYALTNSYNKTAKEFGISDKTVKKIVEKNPKLYEQKKEDFIKKADIIINKAMDKLEKEIDKGSVPANHLATIIGTMYDKRALAKGESTNNDSITIKMSEEVRELSK